MGHKRRCTSIYLDLCELTVRQARTKRRRRQCRRLPALSPSRARRRDWRSPFATKPPSDQAALGSVEEPNVSHRFLDPAGHGGDKSGQVTDRHYSLTLFACVVLSAVAQAPRSTTSDMTAIVIVHLRLMTLLLQSRSGVLPRHPKNANVASADRHVPSPSSRCSRSASSCSLSAAP